MELPTLRECLALRARAWAGGRHAGAAGCGLWDALGGMGMGPRLGGWGWL